jgi:hypothetical protein
MTNGEALISSVIPRERFLPVILSEVSIASEVEWISDSFA